MNVGYMETTKTAEKFITLGLRKDFLAKMKTEEKRGFRLKEQLK